MLEAGSNPRLRNKGGLTPYQLVDPTNTALRTLIERHQYTSQNAGDFVDTVVGFSSLGVGEAVHASVAAAPSLPGQAPPPLPGQAPPLPGQALPLPRDGVDEFDEDADFSGSDDEERAEWERMKKDKARR